MLASQLFTHNHCTQPPAKGRKLAATLRMLMLIGFVGPIVGCTLATTSTGPKRPITIDEDVAWMAQLAVPEPDLRAHFYTYSSTQQATIRNQMIAARMYIADMEYHTYEAQLTRELQDEGLFATLVSLGLTGSASVIPVAHTGRLLSAIATGVTGADKAISEKELLNNTIQALQTQMRRDRKAQAADIYAKMFVDNSQTPTSIDRYPLPMALSDIDHYYQAGTLASALIGLSKTVAKAEQNADDAKGAVSPNAGKVIAIKRIADPVNVTAPVVPFTPASVTQKQERAFVGPDSDVAVFFVEKKLTKADTEFTLGGLCFDKNTGSGLTRPELIKSLIRIYETTPNSQNPPKRDGVIDRNERLVINKQPDCDAAENYFEKVTFANTVVQAANGVDTSAANLAAFVKLLNRLPNTGPALPENASLNSQDLRSKISMARKALGQVDAPLSTEITFPLITAIKNKLNGN